MLDYLIRVGDRVRMNLDAESARWRKAPVANGTLGTVTEIQRYTYYRGRYGNDLYSGTPGLWEKNGCPVVLWDNGTTTNDESWSLADVEGSAYKERYETEWCVPLRRGDNMSKVEAALTNDIKIGELPELFFYERDLVETDVFGEKQLARVGLVMYRNLFTFCDDGVTPMPIYNINFLTENGEERGGSTSVRPENLKLIERGPVWNFYHGIENKFASIQEEASFAKGMHRYNEVRNPESNDFHWTKDEVLQAIHDRIVDGFSLDSILGTTPSISAVKFHDRDLGERVRTETLKGFDR